jgi:hypothetical protein
MITPRFLIFAAIVILTFTMTFGYSPWFPLIADPREAKEALMVFISIGFIGWMFALRFKIGKIPPALIGLLIFCVLRCFLEPLFAYPLLNTYGVSVWQWKVLAYDFLFFLLFVTISSMAWGEIYLRKLFTIFCWVGFLSAVYVIIQGFNLDQWLILSKAEPVRHTPSAGLTGTLTHVTLAAAFLVLTLPFMLQSRRWYQVVITLIAIIMCKSDMAYGATVLVLLWYVFFHSLWGKRIVVGIVILLALLAIVFFNKIQIKDSGRRIIWAQIWEDVHTSPLEADRDYFLTGYGLGSYRYIFTTLHTTSPDGKTILWDKAHNEYLEWFFNTGLIGITLLIFIIFSLIRQGIPCTIIDERYLALLSSFIGAVIFAGGTFIWQVEPHRFFTLVIAAIIQNRINLGEEKEK